MLTSRNINTPLGELTAIASENALHLLQFADNHKLSAKRKRLQARRTTTIDKQTADSNSNKILSLLNDELDAYFKGALSRFTTPLHPVGTHFQEQAWEALRNIGYGKTASYGEQSASIGKPTAYRAVANANSANPISLLIPCHRIINGNGKLGGYAGGVERKSWLLAHEAEYTVQAEIEN